MKDVRVKSYRRQLSRGTATHRLNLSITESELDDMCDGHLPEYIVKKAREIRKQKRGY